MAVLESLTPKFCVRCIVHAIFVVTSSLVSMLYFYVCVHRNWKKILVLFANVAVNMQSMVGHSFLVKDSESVSNANLLCVLYT
jgi:hypothetical protein